MSYWETLAEQTGSQAAGGLVNGVVSRIFRKGDQRAQMEQQKKLQALQIQGQKEMGQYNQQLAMQMWNDTNAGAQIEHYKKAGLNPALMYGGSGAGGSTAATAPGAVSGGNAESGMGLGGVSVSQQLMTDAQADLMRAQAENLRADTAKKIGPDTKLVETTIESLKQGINNAKANEKLTKVQTDLSRIEKEIAESTTNDVIKMVNMEAQKLQTELHWVQDQADITDKTKKDIIKTVHQQLVNATLTGWAIRKGIQVNDAQIAKMSADVAQGWQALSLEERKTKVQELMGSEQKDDDQLINLINGITNNLVDGILIKKLLTPGKPTTIKGFSGGNKRY